MTTEVRVPNLPESVADATVLAWHKEPGAAVRRGENLVDLETDKVVLEVPAPVDGVLTEIEAQKGDVVSADAVLARIEAGAATDEGAVSAREAPAAPPASEPASRRAPTPRQASSTPAHPATAPAEPVLAPAARRMVKEMALDPAEIAGSGRGGRIHKADVVAFLDRSESSAPDVDQETGMSPPAAGLGGEAGRPEQRVPMTRLRARIAERLVEAQQTAAILTTFNEVNLQAVMDLRRRYKDRFEQAHGVRLGFMSFFVKAAVEALQRFPMVNASVDENDIIYHGYYDIGIAVSSPRGLVVPILRDCDQLSMADIELAIAEFAGKAKDGSLSYEDLTGGTFSITNGGVFGSLLSTPILNPPQSAILGMHKVQERPVVEDGAILVRPMMYLALSYDHRLIDGRDAVQFLVAIKEAIEDPARLLLRV
ncbi:2-oxoglutarate dehydrogenase complex dihydrolipoamide succinyltransferase [Thioflavicoccus mobilis 8321]|uniref:Dihydrolipoyllysine-residue succinyltransferase component of 2-oxoglutarate dehydrogenase complex n=1 Tax=Thioflavicoccus mobilis 8321 TaxID=765912 RepID=L0GVY3_9GAMM|nr:2-oxoglutarate dehydrogenase complex dihydrolipoyllysine-residue succinyltransferase [Thioflavicoccus mobilis]AGA89520.1 2-oxoglutarate dehydrogenase complex dihydrolipoamide succinyltransferase [Thioflavicoccus mobilis 8321]